MISRTFAAALVAAGLAAATPALASTDLIVNGGFEAPTQERGGFTLFGSGSLSPTLPGWEVLGPARNAVAVLDTHYNEHDGAISFNAFEGDGSLDLSGGGRTGLESGVRQFVNTLAGHRYTLSFWVGNADGSSDYANPSALTLAINGGDRVRYDNATVTPGHVNWRLATTTFTATGEGTEIAFRNGVENDSFNGLDRVSLSEAVPEPASWALMIAGFGLAGGALRRRARGLAAI